METLTATPIGCSVDHLTNPGVARVFTWIPCDDGTPSCEEMQFDGPSDTITTGPASASHVQEEAGSGVRIELGIDYGGETTVYFAYEDGTLFDAYRTALTPDCGLWQGSLAGSHLGILVGNLDLANPKLGGFTRDLSTGAPPAAFEVTPAPPGFGPQDTPMSPTRWAWQYGGGKVVSVSSLDGSGLVLLAEALNPAYPGLLDAHMVSGAGSLFLIPETFELDGGVVDGWIVSTDGIAQPTDYLRPTDGSFYDFPVFADSHVAWFRGVGVVSVNQYQHVELWASAFSADPAGLEPFKVADYTFDAGTFMVGASGRVAMPSFADPPTYGQQAVYDLAQRSSVTFQLPDGRSLWTSVEDGSHQDAPLFDGAVDGGGPEGRPLRIAALTPSARGCGGGRRDLRLASVWARWFRSRHNETRASQTAQDLLDDAKRVLRAGQKHLKRFQSRRQSQKDQDGQRRAGSQPSAADIMPPGERPRAP